MKNIIYSKTVITARNSEDGETPTQVFVTEENNGYFVWLDSYSTGPKLLGYEWDRNNAIEKAVDFGRMPIDVIETAILRKQPFLRRSKQG